jgi:6-phosphogluconolactonase (cycloisomerase 2 family)
LLDPLAAQASTGDYPSDVLLDPTGTFAYVANVSTADVTVIRVDASGLTLNFVETQSVAAFPFALAADPTGRFLYVLETDAQIGGALDVFSCNRDTGALDPIETLALDTNPRGLIEDPQGQFLFLTRLSTAQSQGHVTTFRIDPISGRLGSAVQELDAGNTLRGGVVDPLGRFAHVADFVTNNVLSFRIDRAAGALVPLSPSTPTGSAPVIVSVDPTGQFLYSVNTGSSDVSSFAIEPITGALTAFGSPHVTGTLPATFSILSTFD